MDVMRVARVVDLRVGDLMRVVGWWEWWIRGCLGGERCGLAAWVARGGVVQVVDWGRGSTGVFSGA